MAVAELAGRSVGEGRGLWRGHQFDYETVRMTIPKNCLPMVETEGLNVVAGLPKKYYL